MEQNNNEISSEAVTEFSSSVLAENQNEQIDTPRRVIVVTSDGEHEFSSEKIEDNGLRLAPKTKWVDAGRGAKILATDIGPEWDW